MNQCDARRLYPPAFVPRETKTRGASPPASNALTRPCT